MEHQWYVLQVFSNFEHKVQRTLTDRIEITGLQSEITDVVVPIEEVVELKGGEKKTTERKFFPGYVLIRMIMNDETWHFVKSIPNVMGFIGGTSEKPTPITENEAMIKTVNAVCNVSSLVGQTTFLISTREPCRKLQKIEPL